ncbi:MAG TPA: purine-nucleoside phosphorylase [Lentisphaeria bacterium]|nr:MAG: purine-nucleoside phosphorylase [Lentisphaerae bacterium GWF2_38_69]HBM15318.1 purine-nucleoside phosphorylase [Lentisphaeria bacterium]
MSDPININILENAWADVNKKWPKAKPFGSFVLGSGWGDAINIFNIKAELAYSEISGFGKTGVVGHAGKLSLVEIKGKEFFVFQGRRHYYEGEGWTPVLIPAYITMKSGAKIFFLSNAAGGIKYAPGDLMVITGHINAMGANPLIGPHHSELGPRFPDQSNTYCPELIKVMEKCAAKAKVKLKKGVYVAASGPSYETPPEIKFYKAIGADAVGMSTVPEAIVANSMGLRVGAMSCITNFAAGISPVPLSHKEVVETLDATMPNIHRLIPEIVKAFSELTFN